MKSALISCVALVMATILLEDLPHPVEQDCVTHRIWIAPTANRAGYWTSVKVCIKSNNNTDLASKLLEES